MMRYTALILSFFIFGCAKKDFTVSQVDALHPATNPRVEVYIAPKGNITLPLKGAIFGRLTLPAYAVKQKYTIKELVKGAMYQSGLFSLFVDLDDVDGYGEYKELGVRDYALDHDIPYLVEVDIKKLIEPVGVSTGYCAMVFTVRRAVDGLSIFSAYGEMDLIPKKGKDYILWTTDYRPAPSVYQGITGIIRAVSQELRTYKKGV